MKEKSVVKKEKKTSVNSEYPFIDNLVDSLFTNELNTLIQNNTELNSDKSVFMMFVNIYFMAFIHTQEAKNLSNIEKKEILKKMLTDVIKCPEKRQVCVSLIKQINPLFDINSITNTPDLKLLKKE